MICSVWRVGRRMGTRPVPFLTIFVYSQAAADTRMCLGNIKGIATIRADAEGATAGKDVEVCSLCHFAR